MNLDEKLTKRELEVAGYLVCGGAIKKEIASYLNRSVSTIDNTTRNIYTKLGINTLGELNIWYLYNQFAIPLERMPILNLARVKKKVIAFVFLMIITPVEIMTNYDAVRAKTRTSSTRGARARRVREYLV